eukprot:m.184058 g.184058  ORF g.184058 m.184058 type:complete len:306 (+) comp15556_c0_seq3:465-1382(+)
MDAHFKRGKLYQRQPGVPDNHVGDNFLAELQVNGRPPLTFWEVSRGVSVVVQQLCSVVLLYVIQFWLKSDIHAQASVVRGLLLVACTVLFTAIVILEPKDNSNKIARFLGVLVSVFSFSPVIETLTISINDTFLQFITFAGFVLHLMCFEYMPPFSSPPAGLNWAMFSAVCLGSRLKGSASISLLILTTIILFDLVPTGKQWLQYTRRKLSLNIAITSLMCVVVALSLLLCVRAAYFYMFVAVVFFIEIICPMWLLVMQKYKWCVCKVVDQYVTDYGCMYLGKYMGLGMKPLLISKPCSLSYFFL